MEQQSSHGFSVGTRVRCVRINDEYTRVRPGSAGTVSFIDSLGTIHVNWDDGSALGIVWEAGDRIARDSDAV